MIISNIRITCIILFLVKRPINTATAGNTSIANLTLKKGGSNPTGSGTSGILNGAWPL